jgi:hypothetical protein
MCAGAGANNGGSCLACRRRAGGNTIGPGAACAVFAIS